ncbi:NDR1/HIN1-like protein 10 [Senna tora]|uniref:NDR1/HIN1-like protein 10 n=1 Tax=Senna tora TaxID=362788 RepID=A0A834WIZ5_9FABA|nr:NDR1/HIN1-like protein 10 [Senna tora]
MGGSQPQLNGAYYGPSIPPPKSYHRPGRGGDCDDCCCGVFCFLLKLLVTIIIIAGIAVLVFWLIVRPNMVKFHVSDASLTQFNYTTSNSTLFYNLALNITIRNPNRKIGIYYDRIEVRALYQDERLDSVSVTPFYQPHKSSYVVSPLFSGHTILLLASHQTDNTSGIYTIDVNMYLKVRFKVGALTTFKFKPKVICHLKLPLTTTDSAAGFQTTKCHLNY